MQDKYKLRLRWSKKEDDILVNYPLGIMTKNDSNFLLDLFDKEIIAEFEKRGYDIQKIKFSIPIKLKNNPRADKFKTLLKEFRQEEKEK